MMDLICRMAPPAYFSPTWVPPKLGIVTGKANKSGIQKSLHEILNHEFILRVQVLFASSMSVGELTDGSISSLSHKH